MNDLEKARDIAKDYSSVELPTHMIIEESCLEMAKWKNEQVKLHEQSLLWCVQSILDNLVIDQESYDIALEEFKSHLTNDFNE